MLFFQVNAKDRTTPWRPCGGYQNTTLRYAPGEDFPAHLEKTIGRPEIIRCFLTMDDAWDYRTGEYRYDYTLGIDPYKDDPKMFRYERSDQKTSAYEMTYEKYLTTHAAHTKYVMLTVRRYEREVANGTVSLDRYEEVLEHLLEHYKALAPNIRYVEGNECNIDIFGNLSAFEYYEIYKRMYTVVHRLNEKHQYEIPLEVGGPTNCGCLHSYAYYETFLRLYAADKNPNKRLDFYATHEYSEKMTTVPEFYRRHNLLIQELGLPKKPIFLDEYGSSHVRADPYYNQMAGAGLVEMSITAAEFEDLYVFPWCTYHDPSLQVSYSMFVDFNRTCGYLPAFLGQAQIALTKLYENRLPLTGNVNNRAVVTTDGESYAILATNRDKSTRNIRFALTNLPDGEMTVETYKTDALHNNCFIDKSVDSLQITESQTVRVENGKVTVSDTLDSLGFTLWVIRPAK